MINLLEMTLTAAVMIILIIIVRALFIHKLPKRVFVVMWAVVVLRLLVPFTFSVNVPALELPKPIKNQFSQSPSSQSNETQPIVIINTPQNPETTTIVNSVAESTVDYSLLLSVIWAGGVVVAAGVILILHRSCKNSYRTALPLQNERISNIVAAAKFKRIVKVKVSDTISSPMTYGIINPVIVLPKAICKEDSEQIQFILAHELVHIKRFDVLYKLILTVATCVHWFNPLVWAMYVFANRDLELSCDEAVLKQMNCSKSDYAMALIKLEEKRSVSYAISGFSRNAVRERIEAIMKLKKTSIISVIVSACLIAGTTTVFASADNSDKDISVKVAETKLDEIVVDEDNGTTKLNVDVEWWTYDEYKAWLEQEKIELQKLVGTNSRGYTGGTGWFTWTQEIVDETIAQYEEMLEEIKKGYKISKSVDGKTDLTMFMGPDSTGITAETNETVSSDIVVGDISFEDENGKAFVTGDGAVGYSFENDARYYISPDGAIVSSLEDITEVSAETFKKYEEFGLTYNEAEKKLYFEGEVVRFFTDSYELDEEGNTAVKLLNYIDDDGTIDVRTIREVTDNGDGSVDKGGKLVGIEKFDAKISVSAPNWSLDVSVVNDKDFSAENIENDYKEYSMAFVDLLDGEAISDFVKKQIENSYDYFKKKYESYGVTYDSNVGLCYKGELIRAFTETGFVDKETIKYFNGQGTVDVYAYMGSGVEIAGVKKSSQEEFDARTFDFTTEDSVIVGVGSEDISTNAAITENDAADSVIEDTSASSEVADNISTNEASSIEGGEWDGDVLSDYFGYGISSDDKEE